jgi:hypothetical protein
MELEQRVKMLEQEVEVLKHQLQTTLLDIQELLLTNAYPSLRSEESGSARTASRKMPQAVEEPVEQVVPVIRRVSLEAADNEDEETPYAEVVEPARKAATKKAVRAPLPADDEPFDEEYDDTPAKPARNGRKPQPRIEDEDEDYTPSRRVAAKKSIRAPLPASDEQPDEEGADVSVRPTVSRNGCRTQPGVEDDNQDYVPAVVGKVIVETPRAQPESLPDLDEWVRNKIEQVGVRRTLELIQLYSDENRITPETREQLLHIVAEARRNSAKRAHNVAQTEQPVSNEEEESQKLILKLIAGVQNAGAGIGRRKKRG